MISLIIVVVCFSLFSSKVFGLQLPRSSHHIANAKQLGLIPKQFDSYAIAASSSASSPTGYVVAQEYVNANTCSGSPSIYYGMGTGVCLVGQNKKGVAIGSTILTLNTLTSTFLQFNTTVFPTLDCSGIPSSNVVNGAPLSCVTPDATSTTSFKYTYTMDMTPWKTYAPGYVME